MTKTPPKQLRVFLNGEPVFQISEPPTLMGWEAAMELRWSRKNGEHFVLTCFDTNVDPNAPVKEIQLHPDDDLLVECD